MTTRRMTYREAVREALRESLTRDKRVFLMGEDVNRYGGAYACSLGLPAEFGDERIRDAPLSESAFVGAGIGAALGGMRPIVEIMTINFSLLALDQIVNSAATLRHMSGGQFSVPIVIRMATGAGRQLAAQHSHSLEGWYGHIPGIRVLAPATLTPAACSGRPFRTRTPWSSWNMLRFTMTKTNSPRTEKCLSTSPRRRRAAKARM